MPSDTYTLIISDVGYASVGPTTITSAELADNAVITSKIADANVTAAKIAANAVTTAKILDANITTAKILDANVTTAKILDANVTTAKILDLNVTTAKIADGAVTSAKLAVGVVSASAITDGSLPIAKLANISANTVLGNSSESSNAVAPISCTAVGRSIIGSADTPTARTNLGLGTMSTQAASAVAITGGTIGGISIDLATTTLAGGLTVSNGGTGLTSYAVGDIVYASGGTTLAKLSAVSTGSVLLSNGITTAPAYGKVGLTTHVSGILPVANGGTGAATLTGYVKGAGTTAMTASATVPVADISGTLPVANGGTGVAASAYGQIGGQTAGTSTTYTTTYTKLDLTTTLDTAAQFDANSVNNRLRYTGSATRKFLVFASMDMFSATDGAMFSIKIAKGGTLIDATQCNAVCPTKGGVGVAKLVSNWIIEFSQNDYVEIFVASVGGNETGTPQRMRLVATPVF